MNLSNKYYMNGYHTSAANYEPNKKTKGFILSDNLLMINHMNTTRLRESLPIQILQTYSNSEQLTHHLICKNSCRETCEIYIYLMMREALRELFVENGPCTVYGSSSYFAGNNICFWLENDEIHNHKHSTGIIGFC